MNTATVTSGAPCDSEYTPTSSVSARFVAIHLDFPILKKADKDGKRTAQWLLWLRNRSCRVYMRVAHERTPAAEPAVVRQPIDYDCGGECGKCEMCDERTDEKALRAEAAARAADEEAAVVSLLDQLSLAMEANRPSDGGAHNFSSTSWREPGQLETFLAQCIEGWELFGAMSETQKQLQEQLKQSYIAVDNLKKKAEMHRREADSLCAGQGTSGTTTPMSSRPSSGHSSK